MNEGLVRKAGEGDAEAVNFLLLAKADVNQVNDLGETALISASMKNHHEVVA